MQRCFGPLSVAFSARRRRRRCCPRDPYRRRCESSPPYRRRAGRGRTARGCRRCPCDRRRPARIDQRRGLRVGAVAGHAPLAVARDQVHDAGLHVDDADPAVVQVGEVELAEVGVECEAIDAAEHGIACRAAVAGIAFLAGAGERGDDAALRIDFANAIVPGVGQIHRAVRRDREVVHAVERGLPRGPPSPVLPLAPVPAITLRMPLRSMRRARPPLSSTR